MVADDRPPPPSLVRLRQLAHRAALDSQERYLVQLLAAEFGVKPPYWVALLARVRVEIAADRT